MITRVKEKFDELFHQDPILILSPGRVNLIGEHTDYNDGFVLPAAIDKNVVMALAVNDSDQCNVYACAFDELVSFDIECAHRREGWINYVLGVVYYLRQQGYPVSGFNAVVDSDLPVGAGLSSSAAVEGATGYGLSRLFDLQTDRSELARIGQLAEHNFAGVKCGIMDQFANLHGKKDKLIRLDCRDLSYAYVPFHFPEYKIVLCNSMVHHSLASSEYNVRRQQCEHGVEVIKKTFEDVKNLRDVSPEMLQISRDDLSEVEYSRCKYVVEENGRLLKACDLLDQNDLQGFGELMYATHEGLSVDYEVSCEELDFLVQLARKRPEVTGARMMGGGFGGCTINIVESGKVDDYTAFIRGQYQEKYGKTPEVYVTSIEDGTRML
jgi:galactokinase